MLLFEAADTLSQRGRHDIDRGSKVLETYFATHAETKSTPDMPWRIALICLGRQFDSTESTCSRVVYCGTVAVYFKVPASRRIMGF